MPKPRLADLEARYSGPIPDHLRQQAMARPQPGSAEAREAAWACVRHWARRTRALKVDPVQHALARHWLAAALAAWRAARDEHRAALEAELLAAAQLEALAALAGIMARAARREGDGESPGTSDAAEPPQSTRPETGTGHG